MANKEQGSGQEYGTEPPSGAHAYQEDVVMEAIAANRVDRPVSQVRWGAIISGVFVTFVSLTLLNVLGLAIGAATFDAFNGNQALGLGTAIWWTISALISLFFGGWVAGRLSGVHHRQESLLHGVVTWAVAMVSMFFVVTTAVGSVIGGAFSVIARGLIASTAASGMLGQLEAQAAQLGLTGEQLDQLQTSAMVASQEASTALATASFWAFVVILLGGLACALGSSLASASLSEEEVIERGGVRAQRHLRPREV
ncbi:hypothetical protein DL240_00875 [Lujinxingia litoralis]|uniref:PhnA-like protein n=1 Tax=Lujinxingia litoralis TaxID=2211119 RepID=A0A328CAT9_9DELT|nr:hypothetical protein [Lujinxingia litoralis]RAL24796.1 hypothetical protein DL240_00875 [Lujinxingia litoralis]